MRADIGHLFSGADLLLAALAILAVSIIFFLYKPRKELAFGLLEQSCLVSIPEELHGRVHTDIDGVLVSSLYRILLGLKNSGEVPILPIDFERRLTIAFGHETKVFSAELKQKHPPDLNVVLHVYLSEVFIEPLLLSPGAQILIDVLASSPSQTQPRVETRIVGLSDLVPLTTAEGAGWDAAGMLR